MPVRRTAALAVACTLLSACAPPALERSSDNAGNPRTAPSSAAGRDVTAAPADALMALDLEALRALDAARLPASAYWQANAAAGVERIERILAAEDSARAALIERFGPAATHATVLRNLFMPLHDRMPELGSAQQIAIHDLERRYLAARLTAGNGGGDGGFDEHLAQIRDQLGEATAGEYALRTSPLAAELRNSGVIASEVEFRDVFEILDTGAAGEGAFVEARRLLRERLGTDRYIRLWSLRDPRFAALHSAAARFDLTDQTLFAAYALLLENEDAMLTAVDGRSLQAPAAQRSLRSLFDDARRRLADLIGEQAAEALLRSFSAASAAASNARN